MTREGWVQAHAYLQPVASLCAAVERAAREIAIAKAETPSWDDYGGDFRAGVPLLRSEGAAIDRQPAGAAAASLVARLAADRFPGDFAADAALLDQALRRETHEALETEPFAFKCFT